MTERLADRKEILFLSIENKIEFSKKIHDAMESLPIPSPDDPKTVLKDEGLLFDGLISDLEKSFPETVSLLKRYEQLDKKFEDLEKSSQRGYDLIQTSDDQRQIAEELNALEENPDLMFLIKVKKGLEQAQNKRNRVRNIVWKLGAEYQNPKAYSHLIPKTENPLKGKFSRVKIGRFSISLITDDAISWWDEEHAVLDLSTIPLKIKRLVLGYHRQDSIWNFLLGSKNILIESYCETKEPKALEESVKKTHDHEDYHSLLEGFDLYNDTPLERLLQRLRRYKEIKQQTNIPKILIDLAEKPNSNLVDKIIDSMHQEIINDLLIKGDIDRPLKLTSLKLRSLLKAIKNEQIPITAEEIQRIEKFSGKDFSEKVSSLYKTVKEKVPGKENDFLMAMVIFPPTKFRHIESLVVRWIGETQTV